eukprot:5280548-Pyramimonas_sp.AAC.1
MEHSEGLLRGSCPESLELAAQASPNLLHGNLLLISLARVRKTGPSGIHWGPAPEALRVDRIVSL